MQMNNILSPVQRSKSGPNAPQFQGWSKAASIRRGETQEQLTPLEFNATLQAKSASMSIEDVLKIVQLIQEEAKRANLHQARFDHAGSSTDSREIQGWEKELKYVATFAPFQVVDAMDRAIAQVQEHPFSEDLAKRIERRLYQTTRK
jgi:hypothetical protein